MDDGGITKTVETWEMEGFCCLLVCFVVSGSNPGQCMQGKYSTMGLNLYPRKIVLNGEVWL